MVDQHCYCYETFVPENRKHNAGNRRHPSSCSQAWHSHLETLVNLLYTVRLLWHQSPTHNDPKIPISPRHHGNMYANSSCQKKKILRASPPPWFIPITMQTQISQENGYCKIEELLPQENSWKDSRYHLPPLARCCKLGASWSSLHLPLVSPSPAKTTISTNSTWDPCCC